MTAEGICYTHISTILLLATDSSSASSTILNTTSFRVTLEASSLTDLFSDFSGRTEGDKTSIQDAAV